MTDPAPPITEEEREAIRQLSGPSSTHYAGASKDYGYQIAADFRAYESALSQALKERDEAREALRPFAEQARDMRRWVAEDDRPVHGKLTVGDFRRARQALREKNGSSSLPYWQK